MKISRVLGNVLFIMLNMLKKKLGIDAIENGRYLRNFFKISSTLIIPESVERIGPVAFWKCRFKEVVIPESVKRIETSAFEDCWGLKKVIISGSVERIGDWAFCNCVELEKVEIPESCKRIGKKAFANCLNLRKVVIPESVEAIDLKAFRGCEKAVVILKKPRSEFKEIEECAFLGCKDVKYVEEENRN